MSKFKFVNVIDTIFISIVIFLIIFAWIQFFVKNLITALILGIFLTLGIIIVIRWFKFKKHIITQKTIDKKYNLETFKLTIQTMPSIKLSNIIKHLLPTKYMAKINKGDITFIKNNTKNIFTFHYSSELTQQALLNIIKTHQAQQLTIFCSNYSQDIKTTASAFKNIKIELVNIEQLFEIFDAYNIKIDTSHINLNNHKITIKDILKNSISRSKSKGYFISGIVLLFTSIIMPYRIYYVVFSSILFALSLICRFKPTPKINHSIFD
jgi:hypothetical protein